jgi:hypothetical protein
VDGASAQQTEAARVQMTGTVEAVLGSAVGADEPLMDAGLDSLRAVGMGAALIRGTRTSSPACSLALPTLRPLTKVPLVEPRSFTSQVEPLTVRAACKPLTAVPRSTMSASSPSRPSVCGRVRGGAALA